MIKTDKVIYHTRTHKEYDWLMDKMEAAGCEWFGGECPSDNEDISDYCIWVEKKEISFSDEEYLDYYKSNLDTKGYEFIEVSELIGNEKETEESELLPDKLEQIFHRQAVLSVQEINLNDAPTDTFSLIDVYEAKREELELDYQEHKKIYQEQKNQYDRIISDKKVELAKLEKKYRNLKIKRIVRYTLIAAIILFILAFAIRWDTLLRNQISSIEQKNEQVGEISTETEKRLNFNIG